MSERMNTRFDGMQASFTLQKLLKDLEGLERRELLQRVGCWADRLTTIGGGLLAIVLTENPAAFRAALSVAGPLEMSFKNQKAVAAAKIADMENMITSTALHAGFENSPVVREVPDE